MTGFNSIQNFW